MNLEILIRGITLTFKQSTLLITDMLPWILGGALIAACIRKIQRVPFEDKILKVHAALAIPIASVSGAASPLCTLGSLPVVTALLVRGLHRGAALAFLSSSSIITPQIAIMTAGFMGPKIAILQVTGGITAGITAGLLLTLAEQNGMLMFRAQDSIDIPEARHTKRSFMGQVSSQLEYSLFWLVTGVVFSQAAVVLSDMSGMSDALCNASSLNNQGNPPSGLFAFFGALLSAPLYSCGGAVLPILAALRAYGIHESFFLAFLICGPATRLRSAAAVGKILTPRALTYYLLYILVFSVLWVFAVGPILH